MTAKYTNAAGFTGYAFKKLCNCRYSVEKDFGKHWLDLFINLYKRGHEERAKKPEAAEHYIIHRFTSVGGMSTSYFSSYHSVYQSVFIKNLSNSEKTKIPEHLISEILD